MGDPRASEYMPSRANMTARTFSTISALSPNLCFFTLFYGNFIVFSDTFNNFVIRSDISFNKATAFS